MTVLLSEEGIDRIRKELEAKQARHQRVCEERSAAFESCGDGWHDNPEFNRLQQTEAALSHEIVRLKSLLAGSRILQVREGERPCDCVRPGSAVEIECTDNDTGASDRALWFIGGEGDSDRSRRILGWDAPLARALALAHPGDVIEGVKLGRRTISIEVLALHPHTPLKAVGDSEIPQRVESQTAADPA